MKIFATQKTIKILYEALNQYVKNTNDQIDCNEAYNVLEQIEVTE